MTRTVLDKELRQLEEQITRMGNLVEHSLTQVLNALETGNQDESDAVIMSDNAVDDLCMIIEEHVFRVLTLQQPLAGRDLRYITSLLPIAIDLERIGDDSEGIAQYILRMAPFQRKTAKEEQGSAPPADTVEAHEQPTEETILKDLLQLGHDVWQALQDTMNAFTQRDANAARTLWAQDRMIDRRSSRINRHLMEMIEGTQAIAALEHDPHVLQRATYLLWISYKLERIADHCTNICERIAFIVEGETDIRPRPEQG